MRFRVAAWIAGCLIAVGIAGWVWKISQSDPSPGTVDDPVTTPGTSAKLAARSRDEYVGDKACSRCHAEIAAHYARSPMSHSWSTQPAEFTLPATVTDPNSPYIYNCRIANDRVVQEETLGGGNAKHRFAKTAVYFVGSGNHAQAMVAESNGYLTQLPAGWFPHEGKWKLNPGYELMNRRFDRPILPGCLACHGGYAKHISPTRNRYEGRVSNGINCEHCHGPGKQHIAFHEEKREPESRDPIVNPKRLSDAKALDVCLQCHLQGDVVVYRNGSDPFSFRPGERLTDHRVDFLMQTKEPEAFGVASHGSRMMRSRCFTGSQGKMTCMTCHDAHRPIGDFTLKQYDTKCAACHQPESCRRELRKNEIRDATGCVRCHMPRRTTREGQHLVYTDHWIQKPPRQPRPQTVPPLLQPDSEVTLVNLRPETDLDQSQLGIAYVKLHASMGPQRPALSRGLSLLETALVNKPDDLQIRYWLATGQIARYQSSNAVAHLQYILKKQPDWHEARFRLAVALHQLKRFREAIAAYERVIRAAPDWMEPYPLVVRLHLSQRNTKDATRLLKQQLSYQQDATAYLSLALAKHLEGKPLAESLKPIDDSLKQNPRNPTAFTTRAYLLLNAGRKQDARADYQRALKIDPKNPEAAAGLQSLGQSD